jgi:hypothetical protein
MHMCRRHTEVLQGNGRSPVLGDESAMEFAADVHAAAEPALVGCYRAS